MGAVGRSIVTMNRQGRITLPVDARRRLGLDEGRQLSVSVDENEIRLRPLRSIPEEDAWLYTSDNIESIRRALADVAAGRTFTASAQELERRVQARLRRRRRHR